MLTTSVILSLGLLGCSPSDSATWTTEPAEPPTEDDSTELENELEDEEPVYEKVIWGYQEGQEALTGLYYADPDQGGVLCEVFYVIDSLKPTNTCKACSEAWIITRGEGLVDVNEDGACEAEGWSNLSGTSISVGYTNEQLWADLGTGWQAYEEAYGELDEDMLFFEISLE